MTKSHWKRDFFTIQIGQAVSLIGSSAVNFALLWWVASETDSPVMMAYASLFSFIPPIILGPLAGVWVDRLKRKLIIISADMFIGVIRLIYAVLLFVYDLPIWSVFIVLGVSSVAGAFHAPAIQSALPMIVPKEQLLKANSWIQFLQSGAFMLGPVIGAFLFSLLPMHIILLTDFIGAVIACSTVAFIKIPEIDQSQKESPHFISEFKIGIKALTEDKQILLITVLTSVMFVFYMPVATYYPLMTSSYFKQSALHGSVVEFVYSLGMMVTALLFGSAAKIKNKLFASYVGVLGSGITVFLSGIMPPTFTGWVIFVAICFIMGGFDNCVNIPFRTYAQEKISAERQGRFFSLLMTFSHLAMPVGLALSSPVAEKLGVNVWFVVAGIASVVISAVGMIWNAVLGRTKKE